MEPLDPQTEAVFLLSPWEEQLVLRIAREALQAHFQQQVHPTLPVLLASLATEMPETPELSPTSLLLQRVGAFVSVYSGGDLRGCIGTFQAKAPLWHAIQRMALHASTQDPRFSPIESSELPHTTFEISVLTPAQRIRGVDEVVIGRDGLIVENPPRRGVLLPQVATKHNWSADEFLTHTCLKANLPSHAWRDNGTSLYRFEALIVSDSPLASVAPIAKSGA